MKYEELKVSFHHFAKCKVKLMMPVLTVKKQIFKHMV